MTFTLTFDSNGLDRLRQLADFKQFLEPNLQRAMQSNVDLLQSDARAYMYANFKNPTGPLEDAVQTSVPDAYTGTVFNEAPPAWRREEGFSGMTDSLGRFFPNDPGIHYFATTLAQDRDQIEARFVQAVQDTFSDMGVN